MAKNPNIKNLNIITSNTNAALTGLNTDVADVISNKVDNNLFNLSINSDSDKSVINSHMTRNRLIKTGNIKMTDSSIYDLINSEDITNTLQTLTSGENAKFVQILKDYEIIKRCIPQIHKVITMLKNNIISPDAMLDSAIGVKMPDSVSPDDRAKICDLVEKYNLNKRLQKYVIDYLVASVAYTTVIPYSAIPDMLEVSINESYNIDDVVKSLHHEPRSLLSYTSELSQNEIINEAADYYELDEYGNVMQNTNIVSPAELTSAINECLDNIEFIDGGFEYFKSALINEAVANDTATVKRSVKSIIDNLKKGSHAVSYDDSLDGLIDTKTISDIRKKVDFKGCHIEDLYAAQVIPFKLRGTLIGYFYVEQSPNSTYTSNYGTLSSIMDKINSSVYLRNDTVTRSTQIETMVVKKISEKLIQCINAKFINDNYDDMDVIYAFVRSNELWKTGKRVIFFHPDDICEYKREDGSIMKNCMYLAKLYILTMLSNILTNVTRGSDRNIYYVKTGLSTDIEGHVNSAIRAIKQAQIRYSDMGTINEVFNIVGSAVDAFMPVSIDGEKPIEVETIQGQNVDMNNDFLNSMLKSIVQSFGVPSSVIDDFENIDFAKTISISNLDMAKASLDAQKEITPSLTKQLRMIISYEMPEFNLVNEVYATLNPPSVIVHEMNKERISSTIDLVDSIAPLMFAPQGETIEDKRIRMFKLSYLKYNVPTLDWDKLHDIATSVMQKSIEEKLSEEFRNTEENQ